MDHKQDEIYVRHIRNQRLSTGQTEPCLAAKNTVAKTMNRLRILDLNILLSQQLLATVSSEALFL